MVLAELYQVAIVFKHLRVPLQVLPVQVVDAVGRLVTVMYALLVAQQFLATQHERHPLRREHCRLCQQVEAYQLVFRQAGNAGLQTIHQAHVVVTAHIADHLRRLLCPCRLRIVHLRHIHLRMTDGAHDAELHTLFHVRSTPEDAGLRVVVKRSAQRVAYLVREGCDARHAVYMRLHSQLFLRIGTAACAPPLAIHHDGRIYRVQHLAYLVHGLDVVNTHQVEAEAVDVVFLHPVFHALLHEAAHHRPFRSRLVATAGAVAVCPVPVLPVVIVRKGTLEVGVVNVIRMVVHHVQDDADARLVQGLHHLLELTNAHLRPCGVGRVRPLRHVVVHGVIAPVILWHVQPRLIYRAEVIAWQDVYGIDAQPLQVTDGPRLGEREKLPRMLRVTTGNGEVAMVHLVNHQVGRRLHHRPLVTLPPRRVGVAQVDNHGLPTVHADGLGKDTRCLAAPRVESIILPFLVALHGGCPQTVARLGHLDFLLAHLHDTLGIVRGEQFEHGLLRRVGHLVEAEVRGLNCCQVLRMNRGRCHQQQRG